MTDLLLLALAAIYVAFAISDAYVTRRFLRSARRRPYIPALTGIAVVAATVTAGGALGALLGISEVWRIASGDRLIGPPLNVILLAVALALPGFGLLFLLRQLRRWSRMRPIPPLAEPPRPEPPATRP